MQHSHEDELFFPALAARVGAGRVQLSVLAGQHEALDAAVQAICDVAGPLGRPGQRFCN